MPFTCWILASVMPFLGGMGAEEVPVVPLVEAVVGRLVLSGSLPGSAVCPLLSSDDTASPVVVERGAEASSPPKVKVLSPDEAMGPAGGRAQAASSRQAAAAASSRMLAWACLFMSIPLFFRAISCPSRPVQPTMPERSMLSTKNR